MGRFIWHTDSGAECLGHIFDEIMPTAPPYASVDTYNSAWGLGEIGTMENGQEWKLGTLVINLICF